jgi:hypothetical protein
LVVAGCWFGLFLRKFHVECSQGSRHRSQVSSSCLLDHVIAASQRVLLT